MKAPFHIIVFVSLLSTTNQTVSSEISLHDALLASTLACGVFSAFSFGAYVDTKNKAKNYSNAENINHETKTLKNHELAKIEESNAKTTLKSFKYLILATGVLGTATIVSKLKL